MNQSERERYSRQTVLAEVGEEGQAQLKNTRVLLVGVGGLGCASAQYLAAAGIGTIGLADDDIVERHNLARQVLYAEADLGSAKVDCAARHLRTLNPEIEVKALNLRVHAGNAEALLRDYDVVVDGSDNMATRYVLNDACFFVGRPLVFGGIHRFEGQVAIFDSPDTACYRCLYPNPPADELLPDCAEAGVLGVLPGMVGVLQAAELIKLRLGLATPSLGSMLHLDMLAASLYNMRIPRAHDCRLCSPNATITSMQPAGVQAPGGSFDSLSAADLHAELKSGTLQLVDVRGADEFVSGHIPGAIHRPAQSFVEGAADVSEQQGIVLYCSETRRAAAALVQLASLGYTDVRVLQGGFNAWLRAGFETADTAPNPAQD